MSAAGSATRSPTRSSPKSSPKSGPRSPQSLEAAATTTLAPTELEVADNIESDDDADSALGSDTSSSTASITSSILQYRTIQGRRYHSDRYDAKVFTPNDEQQSNSMDIIHHHTTLLLDGKLFLCPLEKENIHKVVDIGTGDGIWAIDFGDEYPNAEVIGTDLSPTQPAWIPPNVKFELDDANQPWTWATNTFDLVHIRFLSGSIRDWSSFFKEAARCCRPNGYVESTEFDPRLQCDDGSADDLEVIATWNRLFEESGKKIGQSFTMIEGTLQEDCMQAAGLENIHTARYKVPMGPWTADKKLAEIGQFNRLALETDLQGYTLFLWTLMDWPKDEYEVFLMGIRKALRDARRVHLYVNYKFVYGQKPEEPAP